MKTALLIAAAAMLTAGFAKSEDFTLLDGTQHSGVTVARVEPDGLLVETNSGVIKLPFTKLPQDVQQKYGYNPEKAADFALAVETETRKRHFQKINATLDKIAAHEAEKLGTGGVEVHGFVIHTFKGGDSPVEGSLLDTREFALHGDSKLDVRIPTTIFVEGLTNLADREVFHGTIYPTGRVLREESGSYRAYAVSTAIAYGRIREKGEKTVEQVVTEDRDRWATR